MANWGRLGGRGNIEDRRALGPMALSGGLGVTGVLLVLALNYLGGGNVEDVLTQLESLQGVTQQTYSTEEFEGADAYEVFASTVLGSANEAWAAFFLEDGRRYTPPKLVLFRGSTSSACGGATSDIGPHYCPVDSTIYLDETFFDELKDRLGAQGGDVAEAYVITHEVGHHVQNLLGTLNDAGSNEDSIKIELQADCFAGLWAYSIRDLGVFETGEISEAIDAAAAVGDDRIQKAVTGRVHPESWTHGSSTERVTWFTKGYQSWLMSSCNP